MNENQKTKSMQNKLENLIKNRDFKHALAISDSLHPAEIAEVISIIDEEANNLFIAKLKTQVIAEIINYVDPIFRTKIIQNLKVKTISSVLKNLSDDIATDILQSLSTKKASLVLKQLPKNTSLAINKLSAYEADTAGGRMTGQKISVKPQQNIVEVQNQIRTMKPDFREPFYIYVIDKNQKLIGTMNLRALFATEPDVSVESVTDKDVISVLDTTDQEETARLLKQYNLLALPVVDKKNRLLGTVTHDD